MSTKELRDLKSDILDTILSLHETFLYSKLDEYKMDLEMLEILNKEHKELTGEFYIPPEQVIKYHEKLWIF